MKPVHLFLLVVMNCLWAASLTTFKALAPVLDSASIVTLRYGLASVVMAMLWRRLPGKTPVGRDALACACMGLLVFCASPRLQTAGVQLGLAGDASVLMAFEPLIGAIAAAILLREHVAARRWIGMTFGIAGVLLVSRVWAQDFRWSTLQANTLVVLSFVAETAYSVMGKPLLARAGALKVMSLAMFTGTIANLALDGAHVARRISALQPSDWGLLLYLALVCTVFGYALWLVVLQETPVNITVLTIFVQPIAGIVFAGIFLNEHAHWGQLAGIAAILAGLAVGLRGGPGEASRN